MSMVKKVLRVEKRKLLIIEGLGSCNSVLIDAPEYSEPR